MSSPRFWLIAFLLTSSCSRPGASPTGQPPMVALSRIDAVVERFNAASSEQVQVVAMFSPT